MLTTIHRAFAGEPLAEELPRKFRAYVDLQLAVPIVFHVAFLCVTRLRSWYHVGVAAIGLVSAYHLALLELMPSSEHPDPKSILQGELTRLLTIFLLAEWTARSGTVAQTRAERRCTLLMADCSFAFLAWLAWQVFRYGYDSALPTRSNPKE